MTSAREAGWCLWGCVLLFAARVLGQLEVLLVAPEWLPDMQAWYSGLLPYPVLLPVQIGILMVMAVVAWNPQIRVGTFAQRHPRRADCLRAFACLYFAVMAGRLTINVLENGWDFWRMGAIPVAFHWVLALFVLVSARGMPAQQHHEDDEADDIPHGDVPALAQPLQH